MVSSASPPALSCIVTAFHEGPLAALALNSLIAQNFEDFEILLVDDGASAETRAVLQSVDDPRIRYIRQSNDGPSSARNRALQAAKGRYITFLDSDDTRPPWAFAAMMDAAVGNPDCVFSPGILHELRKETHPFYDARHFAALRASGATRGSTTKDPKALQMALRHLACIEPQPANKMVSRAFLEKYRLRFPPGLFFEDILFHTGIVMNLDSYATTELPCFTYFRRYAHQQTTATNSSRRYDAISTTAATLHLFARSRHFQDPVLRTLVLASACKLLKWSGESVNHMHKATYDQAVHNMILGLEPRYLKPLPDKLRAEIMHHAPWVEPSLTYLRGFADHGDTKTKPKNQKKRWQWFQNAE